MRSAQRVDRLHGDTHAPDRFAHRAFEDIADTELACLPPMVRQWPIVCASSASSFMTLRWREPDSNLYGAFPVKPCFWFVVGSLFGAGKPFLVRSPAIWFAERAEGVKGPKC